MRWLRRVVWWRRGRRSTVSERAVFAAGWRYALDPEEKNDELLRCLANWVMEGRAG